MRRGLGYQDWNVSSPAKAGFFRVRLVVKNLDSFFNICCRVVDMLVPADLQVGDMAAVDPLSGKVVAAADVVEEAKLKPGDVSDALASLSLSKSDGTSKSDAGVSLPAKPLGKVVSMAPAIAGKSTVLAKVDFLPQDELT
jgi:hypothetical protein